MGKRKSNKAKEELEDVVLQGIKAAAEKEITRIAEDVSNEEVENVSAEKLLNNNAGKLPKCYVPLLVRKNSVPLKAQEIKSVIPEKGKE